MHPVKNELLTKKAPVVAEVDTLVIGGGPAGIAAALAAAKNGCRTMLVERAGYLGGMATAGLVMPIMTSFDRDGDVQIIKGIFDEFVLEMEKLGGAIHPSKVHAPSSHASFWPVGHDHCTPFDPEIFKVVAYRMMQQYKVALKLHSWFVEPLMEGDAVKGAIILNKSGFEAIHARVTIDCTGDADVARLSGCKTVKGREKDGLTQPVSLFFRVRNVDSAGVKEYVKTHPYPQYRQGWADQVEKAAKNGDFPVTKPNVFLVETLAPGVWAANASRLHGIDSTNVDDLTKAEILLHEQVLNLVAFFKKYIPGFEKAELLDTANTVGIRESFRIVGEYVLTLDDINTGKIFEDAVALGSFSIDIHDVSGKNDVFAPTGKKWYQIPFRSLIPLKVENLIVAGRAISATHEAAGSIRVMSPCFATGQAAGSVAALSVKGGVFARKVNTAELRKLLVDQDAVLDQPPA